MVPPAKNKRGICCEEWTPISVGSGDSAKLSVEEVEGLFRNWRIQTGTSPETYFDFKGNALVPKNWTGIAPGDTIQLEVLPIGASTLSEEKRGVLDINLASMIQSCVTEKALHFSDADLSGHGTSTYALLSIFCKELSGALRKQVVRKYSSARASTPCAKGRTVFPNQVFESIRRPGYFVSEWVELDQNTPENRFIKAVLKRFKPSSGPLRPKIDELLCSFEHVPSVSAPSREVSQIRHDRLSKEYGQVIKIGRMLLDGKAPGLFSGAVSASSEIIFTASLFESFLGLEIDRRASRKGFKVRRQSMRYLGDWADGVNEGKPAFRLFPDVEVFSQSGTTSCVIDTKWKRLKPNTAKYGVKQTDVFQIITYAVRFGHSNAVLLYPWVGSDNPLGKEMIVTMPISCGDRTINLSIMCVPMLDKHFSSLDRTVDEILSLLNRSQCQASGDN